MKLLKFNDDKDARKYIKEFIKKRIASTSDEILELVTSMIMFKSTIDNTYYINLEKIEKYL